MIRNLLVATCLFGLGMGGAGAGEAGFDLEHVKDIERFAGSAAARKLLARNGFVVADPAFKQIFEPYIKSPMTGLPSFITTDSAWHTYHVLLEEAVKEMEEIQSRRLVKFSRGLLAATMEQEQKTQGGAGDLTWFVSVGLALQDSQYRQTLSGEEKRIVDALRAGSAEVTVPVGFDLLPLMFRAESFYTQSPELSDYFAARQWYASVVFRLLNARETHLAVSLAGLIESRPELLRLWEQLSDPFDVLLAPTEDGTVRAYAEVAKTVVGTNLPDGAAVKREIADIQKALENRLPWPRVNDQLLQPEEYADFARQTRGFRLLPPRRLPSAVCFHQTVDPKIRGRRYPSGLDFLAASPVLRSPAAVRAVENQFGKSVSQLILKADCGPMPDSLHGEALQLLAKLQEPLPAHVPAALRTEAWSDLQLWTQLGAWAEQRHTWALHAKLSVSTLGLVSPPQGMVTPYPAFFSGLAKLSRRTAEAFGKAGLEEPFDVKSTATALLEQIAFSHQGSEPKDEKEWANRSNGMEQFSRFQNWYYNKHRAELYGKHNASPGLTDYRKLTADLEQLARRCAESGQASKADTEVLRAYFDCRQATARMLKDFAPVCERLAELATKSRTGQALTPDDATWIKHYGITLAGFHFYYGKSYDVPRDDFPIVAHVFSNPLTSGMLYAGLARPQALYVLVPSGDGLQLYHGAVMTYREFVRPYEQLLDDDSWRGIISHGHTPPPPPFTRSFDAEKTTGEWMDALRSWGTKSEDASDRYRPRADEILWQLGSLATESDLPALLDLMPAWIRGQDKPATPWNGEITRGLAEIIGGLPWEPYQNKLLEWLKSSNSGQADAAADILLRRPQSLDLATIIAGFDAQTPRVQRLECVLLASVPQQTEATRKALLHALESKDDGVRWQAALALGKANWPHEPPTAALVGCLHDTNQYVAGAAVESLFILHATNAAPALLAALKACAESAALPSGELRRQASAVLGDFYGPKGSHPRSEAFKILDPDDFSQRIQHPADPATEALMERQMTLRFPSASQPDYSAEQLSPGLSDALVESLGSMGYQPAVEDLIKLLRTGPATAARRSLRKLAPDRLNAWLVARALDKQVSPVERDQALAELSAYDPRSRLHDLVPLLEDTTPVPFYLQSSGLEWRICDRAAFVIASLLGWGEPFSLSTSLTRREALLQRVKDWAKTLPP